jgi:2-polyprenyl-6-methoxyphenol hydroxylase-like FAD-dependent oxidoreductase
MLGFLLARAGLDVIVLEKHADFRRDVRGDTIYPSTLRLIDELGLLPQFLALMPQWDLVSFLAEQGQAYPTFKLHMATEATDLIEEHGRIAGARAQSDDGDLEIHADLCVAADGRDSTLRARAGIAARDLGAPIDVLWFRLPRRPDATAPPGRLDSGRILITIDRGSHWQCGYVIAKGGYRTLRAGGLAALRARIAGLAPALAQDVACLTDWDAIELLTIQVNRLETWWRPGLLCIGDAAHAMSPIGGVGVNLAIQDAVAAANELAEPLLDAALGDEHLQRIQRRRQWPAAFTQRLQLLVQNKVIAGVLQDDGVRPPLALRLIDRLPLLRRLSGRMIGMGVRPEHIRTRDVAAP